MGNMSALQTTIANKSLFDSIKSTNRKGIPTEEGLKFSFDFSTKDGAMYGRRLCKQKAHNT